MKKIFVMVLLAVVISTTYAFSQDKMIITFKDGKVLSFDTNTILKIEYGSTQSSGVNLAENKTASASSIYGTGYEVSKANDGNTATRWAAAATDGVGSWLQIDFGTNTTFRKTIISQYLNRITGYKIQYWNGSSWVDAYTGGTMGTSPKVDTFTAVTGSKERLYVTAIQADRGLPVPTIWEFEVYN